MIRSGPASCGALKPKAASAALQGVSRSICARTTPPRNSAARCGNSSGRNRKRAGFNVTTAAPPRNAVSIAAGRVATICPSTMRTVSLPIAKVPSSCSTTSILRRARNDDTSVTTARATVSIQRVSQALISPRPFIRSPVDVVAPGQDTIRIRTVVEYEDHDFACHALTAVEADLRGHAERFAARKRGERGGSEPLDELLRGLAAERAPHQHLVQEGRVHAR